MELTFIRHTAVRVDRELCYGKTDVALADSFPDELQAIKRALTGMPCDAVFCSPLSRCRRLAEEVVVEGGEIAFDDRLIELDFGDWEMVEWDSIFASPTGRSWFNDYVNVRCPNGEAFTDQIARMNSFLHSLRTSDYRHALIVTHAGCIRAALCMLHGKAPADAFATRLDYGQTVRFILE